MTLCDVLLWIGLYLLHKQSLRAVQRNRCLPTLKKVAEKFSKILRAYLLKNLFLVKKETLLKKEIPS